MPASLTSSLATYPYLGNAIFMLIVCLMGMAIFPSQRKCVLLSGLVALPFGVLWPLSLVPAYWTPRLLVHVGRMGVEDIVWAFATGGVAWLTAVVPVEGFASHRLKFSGSAGRYAVVSAVGAAIFMPPWLSGVKVMITFVASVLGLAAFLLWRRPELWRLAICGAIGFGLINLLAMKATLAICPDYYSQMTLGALSGITLFHLPIEEIYWANATGAAWPLVMFFVFDIQGPAVSGNRVDK